MNRSQGRRRRQRRPLTRPATSPRYSLTLPPFFWRNHLRTGVAHARRASDAAPSGVPALRRIAVNLLKQERSCKLGVKSKRLKAGWDESYMLKVLNISDAFALSSEATACQVKFKDLRLNSYEIPQPGRATKCGKFCQFNLMFRQTVFNLQPDSFTD